MAVTLIVHARVPKIISDGYINPNKTVFVKLGNLKLAASDKYTGNGKSGNNV